jgi:hypothetical protein
MVWTDSADYDMDGYFSYRKLEVDVLAAPLERTLVLEVAMCKQPPEPDPCPYITDYYFKADSTDDDVITIELGLPNAELDSGIYQFTFWLMDSVTQEMVVGYITVDDNLKMEPLASDPFAMFIKDVDHMDQIDMDNDQFIASDKLLFDVDATGGTYSAYAILYYRPEGATEFAEYYSSAAFAVESGIESSEWIQLGFPNTELDHGTYDFKLAVFNAENDELVVTLMPEDDVNLNDQLRETLEQDTPPVDIESLSDRAIRVFPNPFENSFSISLNYPEGYTDAIIRLFDSKGILVLEQKMIIPSNVIKIENLEGFQSGFYILEVQTIGAIGQVFLVKY